ncbi:hypothetical protein [Streptomyces apocyni]|uniref:hypothetical protein n=1 Tax=Streptomyces apocyni TaxID=2654677 RepID=UPI0012EAE8F7|nr:hypothetical protein [Streptomyces apocyni]
MANLAQWHASPQRGGAAHSDGGTREIRVPLSLFLFDEHQVDIELVLARVEGEELLAGLRSALAASAESSLRTRPEAVQ